MGSSDSAVPRTSTTQARLRTSILGGSQNAEVLPSWIGSAARQPLITPSGRSRATLRLIPAASTTSTTSATSL